MSKRHRSDRSKLRRVSYRLPVEVEEALRKEAKETERTKTAVLIRGIKTAYPQRFLLTSQAASSTT
jgi:hypothetical protein